MNFSMASDTIFDRTADMYKYKCYEESLESLNHDPNMVPATLTDFNQTTGESLLSALASVERENINWRMRNNPGHLFYGPLNEQENLTCLNKCNRWVFKKTSYQRTLTEEVNKKRILLNMPI